MQPASALTESSASVVKRLFSMQENVILLGGSMLFSLAFASPIPVMFGAACELLWLALGSSSPAVRRWLERRERAAREAAAVPERQPESVPAPSLAPDYARRVVTLERALATIRAAGGARPQPAFEQAMLKLDGLRPVYLGLCETHQRIGRFVSGTTEVQLVAETERLKNQFAAEKDLGTRLTLRQAMAAAQRHVQHRRNMADLQRSIGVKLESVERSLAYLVSQGLAVASNPALPSEVDALLAELGPPLDVEVEAPAESIPPGPVST